VELIDRFGLLPEPARALMAATRLRLRLLPLGIRKLELGPGGGRFLFGPQPRIDIGAMVRLVQSDPKRYRLDGEKAFRFHADIETLESRVSAVERLLNEIAPERKAA